MDTKDPNQKLLKLLEDASLSLGEAMHEACKNRNFPLSDEILEIVRQTEGLEARLNGHPINRKART